MAFSHGVYTVVCACVPVLGSTGTQALVSYHAINSKETKSAKEKRTRLYSPVVVTSKSLISNGALESVKFYKICRQHAIGEALNEIEKPPLASCLSADSVLS